MSHEYWKFTRNESEICCSTFGQENRELLVNCDKKNQVHLWNIANKNYVNTLAQCKSSVESVCFDYKEVNLSFGSSCGSIVLYNIESLNVFWSLPNCHNLPIYGLDFHPYSTYFASSSNDCALKVWDIKYKRCITQLNESSERINTMKWSPDGSWIILFGCEGNFSKMYDVISGRVLFEFDRVYCGDFHPKELVLCTVARRKPRTRKSNYIHTIEVWDLQTFTIISQLDINNDDDSLIKKVYFSPLNLKESSSSYSATTYEKIYLFTISDTKINVFLWDPEIILVTSRNINQSNIVELSVVNNIMMTCSNDKNATILWTHDFSEINTNKEIVENYCITKNVEPLSQTTMIDTIEPLTPLKTFNPTISTPKHVNIFSNTDSQFKTSTVVRKNLKAPTVIDSSLERRKSVDGSIKVAMERHLLRNTFILSPGSRLPPLSNNGSDITNSNVVINKIIENAVTNDDTLSTCINTPFMPKKNSTMSIDTVANHSSKTMILEKNTLSSHLTLTTDQYMSNNVQNPTTTTTNIENTSFYRNFDYRHNHVLAYLHSKIQHFETLLEIITSNSTKSHDLLSKLLDSLVKLNDVGTLKAFIITTSSINEQWTIDCCNIFLEVLCNKILKCFNPIDVICLTKKIISKVIIDHGDTLKDKSTTFLYKKLDPKLECKRLMKKISFILASIEDENLYFKEQMDVKETRCLIKSVIGSGLIN